MDDMSWPLVRPVQLWRLVTAGLVASLVLVNSVRADEPEVALLARHELWLSLSATLLTAGITGSYALKVAALNDRVDSLVLGSNERPQLAQDELNARRLAWGFGTAASLFALTTVLVIVFQPGRGEGPQLAATVGAGELGVRYNRRF